MSTPRRTKIILKEKISSWIISSCRNFYKGREQIIEGFKKVFPLNYDEEEEQRSRYKEEENAIRASNDLIDYEELNSLIILKERDIVMS